MDACQALHSNCVLDDWSTSAEGPPVAQQGYSQFLSRSFRAITWRKVELARDLVNQVRWKKVLLALEDCSPESMIAA